MKINYFNYKDMYFNCKMNYENKFLRVYNLKYKK